MLPPSNGTIGWCGFTVIILDMQFQYNFQVVAQ